MSQHYNRRSIRLKHYDYSNAGCYFVTVCTQERRHLFGEIVDGKMVLNEAGKMIDKLWYQIMDDFPHVYLHEFVILPNHIHGIIEITNNPVGADSISAQICIQANIDDMIEQRKNMTSQNEIAYQRADIHSTRADMEPQRADMQSQRADMESAPTLGTIIQSFKRHTTIQYIKMVKNGTLPPFNKRIWQRNYYEHIIRDDVDYERVAMYTINNPKTWEHDVLSNEYNDS